MRERLRGPIAASDARRRRAEAEAQETGRRELNPYESPRGTAAPPARPLPPELLALIAIGLAVLYPVLVLGWLAAYLTGKATSPAWPALAILPLWMLAACELTRLIWSLTR